MATARGILERGGAVCIFPEGTRIRTGSLAEPKRGVGRLALETGAAVVPVAVIGTEHVRRGWRISPRKVKLRAGGPDDLPADRAPLARPRRDRHGAHLAQHRAPVGVARRAAAAAQGRRHRRRELGHRDGRPARPRRPRGPARLPHPRAGRADRAGRENERYLPGVGLDDGIAVKRAADIELAGPTSSCLAVPSAGLPAAVGGASATGSARRSAVLLLTKGFVAPMGALPTEYVVRAGARPRDRVPRRPGPRREAAAGTAALVLGSARRRPARPARRGLRPRRARLRAHRRRRSASRPPAPPRTPPPSPPPRRSRTA